MSNLPADDAAEVARLRAEVARLERELQETSTAPPSAKHGGGGWWRVPIIAVCLVLVGVLAPLSILATWAHDEVSDTDRYVETVAPLADSPEVQAAVTTRLTARIVGLIDVQAVTKDAIDALSAAWPSAARSRQPDRADPTAGGGGRELRQQPGEPARRLAGVRGRLGAGQPGGAQPDGRGPHRGDRRGGLGQRRDGPAQPGAGHRRREGAAGGRRFHARVADPGGDDRDHPVPVRRAWPRPRRRSGCSTRLRGHCRSSR